MYQVMHTREGIHTLHSKKQIALSGSFSLFYDGTEKKSFLLINQMLDCLYQPEFGELQNFSSGAVCLVLASDVSKKKIIFGV
jgi:hypothetical protein